MKTIQTCSKCGKKTDNNDTTTVNGEKWCIDCAYEDYKKQNRMDMAEMRAREKEINNTLYA